LRRHGGAYHDRALPDLRPFAGLRYDPRAVPDLAAVLCPPYDIIGPAERERLARRDARNAVHVELPLGGASGGDPLAPYADAARRFEEWQAAGVLARDRPSLYVCEQQYRVGASEEVRVARGVYAALRLDQPGAGVRRHELTMAAPKEDRLRLLRAVRANLSPVLLLYADGASGHASAELIDSVVALGEPDRDATTDGGMRHRLWVVPGETAAAGALLDLMRNRPLTIADGHHRYETALRHAGEPGAPRGADWVMALLYDAESGGLSLLPTHRLLHGGTDAEALLARLAELFTTTPVADAVALVDAVERRGTGAIGVWTPAGGALLEPTGVIQGLLPRGSNALRGLDVSVLGAALERILGDDAATLADAGRLSYTKDAADALSQVGEGQADACFLLAATPIEAVMAVAEAGELMPPKSTYFVPKAATGLVFNPLD
jgi:uncharacterized protein (DUF1015 family)